VLAVAVGALALSPFVLLAPAGGAAASSGSTCGSGSPRLSVEGLGTATATPDLLTVAMDVSVTAGTATAALDEDNGDTAAVTAAWRAGGVGAADLQTTDLSVEPEDRLAGGDEVVVGYEVDNTVVAAVRDLARAGSLIDAVSAAAATRPASSRCPSPSPIPDRSRTAPGPTPSARR